MLNETHRHDLRSWVESANDAFGDFPIQNLPYGVFRRRGSDDVWQVGVAIGDMIVDVSSLHRAGMLGGEVERPATACDSPSLNALMALGARDWHVLRAHLSRLLRSDTPEGVASAARAGTFLVPMQDAELSLPATVGDYSDFYASVSHATNVGSMFRPDSPLLPNYKWVPIGYHGRASSIVVSGTPVRRPTGQVGTDGTTPPLVAPTQRLDYEAEIGFFVGPGNTLGEPIPIGQAEAQLFGICLLNDWSARDVQAWEYQPLGPFLAKSFATTVSPWVVTFEALAPFRAPAFSRPDGDPLPLPYLLHTPDQAHGGVDLSIEVWLRSLIMREHGLPAERLSVGTLRDMYWTPAQLVTHHASNGCNLRPGDLLGSGTLSGSARESRGCLLELTWRGSEPLTLTNGERRSFLADGDEVIMRASCQREGFARIGLGACAGVVVPS